MAGPRVADRIKETSTTTGTGTLTLLGAVTGFRSFSVFTDGDTCYYVIVAVDASGVPTGAWEVGIGTVGGSGTTLARDGTIFASSNSGSLVNFGAGTKHVFVDQPAGSTLTPTRVPFVDADGRLEDDAGLTYEADEQELFVGDGGIALGSTVNGQVYVYGEAIGINLEIFGGNGDAGHQGGDLFLHSGQGAGTGSGDVILQTASDSAGGTTGNINIRTGNSSDTGGRAGEMQIYAGDGDVQGGAITLRAGGGAGSHGYIFLSNRDSSQSINVDDNGVVIGGAKITVNGPLLTSPVAVGDLPAASAGLEGARAFVNDSNAVSFTAGIGAVVAAGGSTKVPVFCDGTNWRIG